MRQFINNNSRWIMIILVALNLGLTAIIAFGPKPGPPPERMVKMWEKELGLSPDQTLAFRDLELRHRQSMDALFREMNQRKAAIIGAAVEHPGDSTLLTRAIAQSDSVHHALNDQLIRYYSDLKAACTEAQQERLSKIYRGVIERRPRRGN